MPSTVQRRRFFAELRAHISPQRIFSSSLTTADASGFSRHFDGMILAKSEVEIARVLKAATRWRIPVHPVATGLNVGYGDCYPHRAGVILNLKRMNRILEFNRDEGWLRIQPGVT